MEFLQHSGLKRDTMSNIERKWVSQCDFSRECERTGVQVLSITRATSKKFQNGFFKRVYSFSFESGMLTVLHVPLFIPPPSRRRRHRHPPHYCSFFIA